MMDARDDAAQSYASAVANTVPGRWPIDRTDNSISTERDCTAGRIDA